jgi:serine/threonine-protein kinase
MAPAPRTGTEFAGYRIEGLLGRGGMGVVYRAEHPRVGASIALKVMDPELATNESFRERFVRESRVAARIRHPNIIPIYDAGEWQGELYIAMRYVEGDDLRSALRKNGTFPAEQATVIGLQIASALDAAHRGGLVHRDVKPANILVESGPDPDSAPIAYLADLGLTKQVDSQSGVTGTGELLGTIDYIAPEQVTGSRIDGRADVYSLACVLFECLTGSVPYVRENQAAVLWGHLHDEVPRATAVNASLPTAVDSVLARGMAKSPEDRFSTARELVAALRAALDPAVAPGRGETETRELSGPPSVTPALESPAAPRRRGKRGLALAVAAGAFLGGAGVAGILLLLPDRETAAPAVAPEESPTVDPEEPPPRRERQAPRRPAFTPFDKALLRHVPDEIRDSCRHARPLTGNFDATVSCRPRGVPQSATYSHARSGFYLHDFLVNRITRAGLTPTEPLVMGGLCSTGDVPAVNDTVATGLRGRVETLETTTREERLGVVLCYRRGGRAWIEWTTRELGVYAMAVGNDLGVLYEWWNTEAGPEP